MEDLLQGSTANSTPASYAEELLGETYRSKMPQWFDYAAAVYLAVSGIFAICVNGTVLLALLKGVIKCGTFEIYLLNLAVIDSLLVLAFPLVIISSFYHTWIFGEAGSDLYAAWCFYFGLCSICTLAILALSRYIKICTNDYNHYFTRRNAMLSQGAVYAYALVWALMPVMGWGKYGMEPAGIHSSIKWNYKDNSFAISAAVCCCLLPFVCMLFSYTGIVLKLSKSGRNLHQPNKAFPRMAKLTFAMCGGFLVAWGPYAVVSFVSTFVELNGIMIQLSALPPLFAKSCVFYNPIIYFLYIKRYRKACCHLFVPPVPAVQTQGVRRAPSPQDHRPIIAQQHLSVDEFLEQPVQETVV